MSMTTLTILQFITMFCSYSLVVIILPAIVFRSLLRGRSLSEQFLLCLVIGNFFIMNISNKLNQNSHRVTLIS